MINDVIRLSRMTHIHVDNIPTITSPSRMAHIHVDNIPMRSIQNRKNLDWTFDSKVATELLDRARIAPPHIPSREVCNYPESGCFEAFVARHPVWEALYNTSARHYYPETNEVHFRSSQSIDVQIELVVKHSFRLIPPIPFHTRTVHLCNCIMKRSAGHMLSFNVTSYYTNTICH